MILIDQRRRAQPARATEPAGPPNDLVQTAVALLTDYAVLCLGFALFRWQRRFRLAYTALFLLNALLLGLTMLRWWLHVRAMDPTLR